MRTFYVYILTNKHRTVYYTGITNNLERRVAEHQSGRGSSFTSFYRVHDLIYFEEYAKPMAAIFREKEIKKWRREKKLRLVKRVNPELKAITSALD